MRRLILVALLAAVPAHASLISVPADMPSVQQALDAGPDTVLVGASYALAEDVTIVRGVTIVGEGASHPALGRLSIDCPDPQDGRVRFERIGFAGASGTGAAGDLLGEAYVRDCLSSGTVQLRSGRVDIVGLTISPGYGLDVEGTFAHVQVTDVHVSDVAGTGIRAVGVEASRWIERCVIERCVDGLVMIGGGTGAHARNNTIRDCSGDGINAFWFSNYLDSNRVERCGRGIVGGSRATANVVLNSVGDGIVETYGVYGNTIVGSGGYGIGPSRPYEPGAEGRNANRNLVAFNAGVGIVGSNGSCNLVWQNGLDSKLGAISADPQFCDLAGGDLRVASSSAALGGPCGQIGALGAGGCTARGHVAALSENPWLTERFGVSARGRVALVTLSGSEPASLEVLDVAGRRLSHTTLTTSREVALDQSAGVYFLRLTQGVRSASAKAVAMPGAPQRGRAP